MTTANIQSPKVRKHYDVVFPIVNTIILIVLMFVTLYPVINTVAYSFNDGTDALKAGIGLWPRVFSVQSYKSILSDPAVYQAAWISASKTVIITILNLFWTSMLAYTLTRKEYVLRKLITTMMVLTMYVNAGLIPNYLLITKTLHPPASTARGTSASSGRSSSRCASRCWRRWRCSSPWAAGTAGSTPTCTTPARSTCTVSSTC